MSIPRPSLERLPRYYRAVYLAAGKGATTISSQEIAKAVDVNVVQVRKDLAYFGGLGRPGVGYNVQFLVAELGRLLGIERATSAVLVGAGHLGVAIANYHGFNRYHFNLAALFDVDAAKIGTTLTCGISVRSMDEIESFLDTHDIELGIITVPTGAAQSVADIMVAHGIRAIWNFSSSTLHLPDSIILRNEDLTTGLVTLCYHLANAEKPAAESSKDGK